MRNNVVTPQAPAAIGPYAQAVQTDTMVFTSGQLPIDPATGLMPDGIVSQARQSLSNVKAVLEAAGTDLDHVVKTTVFLKDMGDFAEMNEVYATFFQQGSYPARSAVQVSRLPKDALLEIEAIAIR